MVVFSRKLQEELVVAELDSSSRQLRVTVLEINAGSVNLGIELCVEDPITLDRSDPQVRALVARLWRHRNRLRSPAAFCGLPESVIQELKNSEGTQHGSEGSLSVEPRTAAQQM